MTPVVSTSDSHSESKPRRSMCCTACTNASESDAPAAPRPTPMRIFMGFDRGYNARAMWRWLSVLCALLVLSMLAVPTHADTWYRGALLRRSLEPPYRSQLDESIYARSDCGPAVLGMVLADYGVDEDTLDLRRLTHTYQGTWPAVRVGTALQHIAHVAEDFGLATYGLYDDVDAYHQWSADEISTQVAAG